MKLQAVTRQTVSTAVLELQIQLADKMIERGDVDSAYDKYRDEFYAAYKDAKDIVEKVHGGDTSVTQQMVDAAWTRLLQAGSHLSSKKGDPTELKALYDEAAAINLGEYLPEGQDAFIAARDTAKAVLDDAGNNNQETMDAAKDALQAAMDALVKKPNKDELADLLEQAKGESQKEYTEDSLKNLQDAIDAGQVVFDNPNATQDEVTAAEEALQNALDALKPDKSGLEDLIDKAEGTNKDNYTSDSVKDLEDALDAANKVNADENATLDEVKKAEDDLQDALDNLKPDKGDLQDLIDKAEGTSKDDYTEESVKDLEDALDAAKDVNDDPDATVDEIKEAEDKLQDALDNLKPDKGNLGDLIDKAEGTDKDDYTDDSVKDLEDALDAAKDVYDKEDATLDEIKEAEKNLEDALDNLKPDKGNLGDLIEDAENEDKNDYDDDAWDDLQNALEDAKNVYENENATLDEVKAAEKSLKDALAAAKENKEEDKNSGKTDKKDDKKDNKNDKDDKKAAKTGDAANPAAMAGLMAAAAAAIAAFRKKQR